jgi:enterochelin esterase-like enzyme
MTRSILAGALLLAVAAFAVGQTNQAPLAPAPEGFDKPQPNVAKGNAESVEYESKSVGVKRNLVVYTPPGYSKEARYPVFYLLHGSGDDEKDWNSPKKGSAGVILDNLYAGKKLVPMIVVMPYGYASKDGKKGNSGAPFEEDLIKDIIPFVDSHYPVMADSEHRAVAGLSMGGGQALRIGLKHLDTFAWIGGFSSGLGKAPNSEMVPEATTANKQLRLLWISCGDKDGLMKANLALHTTLEEKKVNHVWHIDVGGAHAWPVWKNDLYLLSQMLFREKK